MTSRSFFDGCYGKGGSQNQLQVSAANFKTGYEYKIAGVIDGGISSVKVSSSPLSLFHNKTLELLTVLQQNLKQAMGKISQQYEKGSTPVRSGSRSR